MTPLPPQGLYAITDPDLTGSRGLSTCVEEALRGGAVMVQYRNKHARPRDALSDALSLLALCRRYNVPLIVNDDTALAARIGADGVHVGRDDEAVGHARALLGSAAIVGASCYHDLAAAQRAAADGASYVAFGRVFPSRTKPGEALATPDLLRVARQRLNVPVVAIGGITHRNGAIVVAAGAQFLAVIHDLWAGEGTDGMERARALSACFD